MNSEFFKIKFLNKDKFTSNTSNEIYNELFSVNDINLVIDKNSNIIKKSEYENFFKNNNNTDNKDKIKRKNPYSFEHNQKIIKKIDPEKKQYLKMSINQLQDLVEKYKSQIEEMKNSSCKKEEINKYLRLSDKWLKITQEAIYTILEIHPQNNIYEKNTIKSVLNYFKIEKELVKYNSDEDCFE